MVRFGLLAEDGVLVVAYVIYALVAAAFFVVNLPPYQNADETNHLLRADNISRGYLIGHRFGANDAGGTAAPEIDRSGRPFNWPKGYPDRKVSRSMYDAAFEKFGEPGADITFRNTVVYPPTFYVPSVVAIWIGKAGRMSVLQTLYLARLLTALASAGLIAAALLICHAAGATGAAVMIFAVATLPMALSLQSACSQDGPMLATAALAAAVFARLRRIQGATGFAWLCLLLALIAMSRPAYIALALLPLAVPAAWRVRLRGAAFVVLACCLWTLVSFLYTSTQMVERGVDLVGQLRVLLDPVRDAKLLLWTFNSSGWRYLSESIGQLGWLDVWLPFWFIEAAAGMLLLAALVGVEWRSRAVIPVAASVLLSFLLIHVLIYVTWDKVGASVIEGVQGRYFLPLLMIVASLGTTLLRTPFGPIARTAIIAFPALSLGVTMRAVVLRYYLGP